jgi:hypothetical protein
MFIKGDSADALQILNHGQFGLHLHLGTHHLLHVIPRLVILSNKITDLGISEESLETVDRNIGIAEVPDQLYLF